MPAARRLAASPRVRSLRASCTSAFVGPPLPSPGVSSTQGRPSNWGAARKAAQPPEPSSPSPTLAWRSRLLPRGVIESLRCRQPSRSRPTRCSNSAITASTPAARADVIPRRQQVAGVQAHAEALLAAGGLDQAGELLEAAPERPAGAGGVLQVAAGSPRSRPAPRGSCPPARLIALPTSPVLAEPGCSTTPAAPMRGARAQGVGQRPQRFAAHVAVLAGAVEQVDGVDHDRLHRAGGEGLAERARLLVRVDAALPHARRLVEDLDRLAAALHAPLDGVRQAAGGGHVGADQHGGALSGAPTRRCGAAAQPSRRARAPRHYAARDHEGPFRAVSHGCAAHRRRPHRAVQLAAGAPLRRRAGAAHRGHRPRALHAGEHRADPRRAGLAGARLGRGADPADRPHAPPRRSPAGAAGLRARLPLDGDRR